MRSRRFLLAAMLIAAALGGAASARAQVSETAVKAAFLPRFARYVTWPAAAIPAQNAPFLLCVIGGDPFGSALDEAGASQSIDGHRIVIRRLQSVAGSGACHIAFVQGGRSATSAQILAALGNRPILTVTDARGGAQRGMIHFAVVGGRVRFYINEAEAARHGLAISSRLLALAVGVRQR